jgi:hypothetical protein
MNMKNKFIHKLRLGVYKVAMPIWIKKEQELHEVGIPDPLEGCTLHTNNWIWCRSHTYGSEELVTSSSEVTSVIEKAKTLTAKEKTDEFKLQQESGQLSSALKNEEHRGHTRAISSITSWKEEFVNEIHLYKKRRTHEPVHNDERVFAQ